MKPSSPFKVFQIIIYKKERVALDYFLDPFQFTFCSSSDASKFSRKYIFYFHLTLSNLLFCYSWKLRSVHHLPWTNTQQFGKHYHKEHHESKHHDLMSIAYLNRCDDVEQGDQHSYYPQWFFLDDGANCAVLFCYAVTQEQIHCILSTTIRISFALPRSVLKIVHVVTSDSVELTKMSTRIFNSSYSVIKKSSNASLSSSGHISFQCGRSCVGDTET